MPMAIFFVMGVGGTTLSQYHMKICADGCIVVYEIDKIYLFANNCLLHLRMCIFCSTFGRRLRCERIPPKVRSHDAVYVQVRSKFLTKNGLHLIISHHTPTRKQACCG